MSCSALSASALLNKIPNGLIFKTLQDTGLFVQQVRTKWADWRMIKDVKKRKIVKEFADERLRIQTLRKNNILPVEIRELADKEIADMPRASNIICLVNRCAITSRPRGVVCKWRLSRIVWRSLADYNKLSGVMRARW